MRESRWKPLLTFLAYTVVLTLLGHFVWESCNGGDCSAGSGKTLILKLGAYQDEGISSTKELLLHRIAQQPFNLIALAIFVCAICHTFVAHYFSVLSKRWRDRNARLGIEPVDSFGVEFLRFMGEVEIVFGIWVIPLFIAMTYAYDWPTAVRYMDGIEYAEAMFVVVIMAMASTRPVVKLAEDCLTLVARMGGGTIAMWWWSILTLGPLVGSLITEPGAMTISALLLGKKFYNYKPSDKFSYATLGLLFTNISVGGVFTNFAAPPVLMVSKNWHWDTPFMALHFGWKALLGILIANTIYFFLFRSEFSRMESLREEERREERESTAADNYMPAWVTLVHLGFLAWVVVHNHHPVMFIGCFLLFLGFYQATLYYQKVMELKPAILVGFFIGGLVVHGNLQGWWIEPLISKASEEMLLVIATILTSFNDNAEITFLATLIPSFDDMNKYAVVAGAVTGGGLTVIANAPNPTGQSILGKYFFQGVSAIGLLCGALLPTIVMGLCFYLLRMI